VKPVHEPLPLSLSRTHVPVRAHIDEELLRLALSLQAPILVSDPVTMQENLTTPAGEGSQISRDDRQRE
jgi:hypothetical protein